MDMQILIDRGFTPTQAKIAAGRLAFKAKIKKAAQNVPQNDYGSQPVGGTKIPSKKIVKRLSLERRLFECEQAGQDKHKLVRIPLLTMDEIRQMTREVFEQHIGKLKQELERKREENPPAFISMKQIALEVAQKYRADGLKYADLFSKRRHRLKTIAAFECYYRARTETAKSMPQIGRFFGGMDHTSVLHGIRRYREWQSVALGKRAPRESDKKIDFSKIILPNDKEGCDA